MNNFSTEPTRKILDRLGSPDKKLKIIHIAGTNGKGSTAEFFTNVLVFAGKKTGTFTSPAVYSYNDQFRIDGTPLSDKHIENYFGQARAVSEGINASEFEIETAGALYAFYKEGCEWAVIECGMGGLTDATNAVFRKELAVITSVSLEHTGYLGNTVTEICRHKAGIIKNCPLVVNSYQTDEAKRYFAKLGAVFADVKLCGGFEISVNGNLQAYNAATAIAGAKILGFDDSAVYGGIKNTHPRGRLENFEVCGRSIILDGAHNPAAFEPLADFIRRRAGKKIIIFGCLSDKDIDGNLGYLKGLADGITAVECPGPRARSLSETSSVCRKYFKDVKTALSITEALDTADAPTVAVCGSFTLLKEAKEWIEKRL